MNQINITTVTPDDERFEELGNMFQQLHVSTTFAELPFSKTHFLKSLKSNFQESCCKIWVAEDTLNSKREIIGFLCGYYGPITMTSTEQCIIEKALYIAPIYRGKGILKLLIKELTNWAIEKNARFIYSSIFPKSNTLEATVKKMEHYNFTPVGAFIRKTVPA